MSTGHPLPVRPPPRAGAPPPQARRSGRSAGPLAFRDGDELTVQLAELEGIAEVEMVLDDERWPMHTTLDPDRGTVTATLQDDVDAGHHVVTVVLITDHGRLHTDAIVFEAVAP